ncbi:MAG: transposase [Nanoarchaeota archaeon]|nr:transposase [Nanoarchaeota archaeon]
MEFSRMYQYRLYPSGKQQVRLLNQFKICKEVYNILLAENREHFFTSRYDFNSLVSDIKLTIPEKFARVHSQVLQNISDRIHKALDNFFHRVKDPLCRKKGFPRFKSKIRSITYPQSGFKFLDNRRLQVSKIGNLPIILHRIPKGKIKTLTIKQNHAGQWFAVFSCEVDIPEVKHPSTAKIGIDVGLENFLTDNKGQSIANPRFYVCAERKLARLQRVHSKRVKGSKNREKSRVKLAKQHLKVFNQRTDFLHKASSFITKEYKIVCGERLNIQNMLKTRWLAKHILDVSWGRFYQMLSYKAVTCGGELRKNPQTRGSSCRCSRCGTWNDMPLSKRTFKCPICGFSRHRDHNASINHVKDTVGLSGINTPVETVPLSSLSAKVSAVVESGTINGC